MYPIFNRVFTLFLISQRTKLKRVITIYRLFVYTNTYIWKVQCILSKWLFEIVWNWFRFVANTFYSFFLPLIFCNAWKFTHLQTKEKTEFDHDLKKVIQKGKKLQQLYRFVFFMFHSSTVWKKKTKIFSSVKTCSIKE